MKKIVALTLAAVFLGACAGKSKTPEASSTTEASPAKSPETASSAETAAEATLDPRYVWDLSDLYPTPEAWNAARTALLAKVEEFPRHKGTLGKSAAHLEEVMGEMFFELNKEASRIFSYASLSRDEDQRVPAGQSRFELARAMYSKLGQATSWVQPELLELGPKKIERFIAQEPGLQPFAFFLRDTVRLAPHTLDKKGEQLLASSGLVMSSPGQIYQLLANADIPWPTVTLSDGTEAFLNSSGYTRYRSVPNRADRKKVMESFFATWKEYEDSIGATLGAAVQAHLFTARARSFESALASALADDNIPPAVYRTLVAETNAALPTLHRYFRLRAKMLRVDDIAYYDIYPPLVELEGGAVFDIERSKEITLVALEPFGEDYTNKLEYAFSQKWMHGQPRRGKRSGAYMNGSAYDVHPYILLNHNDDYEALSTFAHEWGHAVHTMLAVENQPYPTAGYSIFTAEMASTINEILLQEHMIKNAKSKEEKLFYLGQSLEAIRGTLFRQAMFGEFELAIHEAAEKGEPLSGTRLSEMYLELLRKYHGHDEGVMSIDEAFGAEWMYIPHFYYDFYVYQYATSISGAAWFAEKFLNGDDSARVAFLNVLKAGGSDYPYEILKEVGLDLAEPEPYRAAFRRMNDVMDRIEALSREGDATAAR